MSVSFANFFRQIEKGDTIGNKIFWLVNFLQSFSAIWILSVLIRDSSSSFADRGSQWDHILSFWMLGESLWRGIILFIRIVTLVTPCLMMTTAVRAFIAVKSILNLFIIIILVSEYAALIDAKTYTSMIEYTSFMVMNVDVICSCIFVYLLRKTITNYNRTVPVSNELSLPTHKYTLSTNENEDKLCLICLSEFIVGEQIKTLPCKHFYHVLCIDQWLVRKPTCPKCKRSILDIV